jgi:hypothetical protein
MKSLFKYLLFVGAVIPNLLSAQLIKSDTTKPSPYILYCNDRDDKVEKPVHMDWVQKDKDIITEQLNKLPSQGSTITGIEKIVPHFVDGKCNCRSNTEDLGYGLKSTAHTIHGGYGSCIVDAVYFGNNVIKLRLTIENHKEIIESYLLAVMQLPFQCINGQISYEITYPENLQKYRNDSAQLFIESADTNLRRREAINYFTDVLTGGTFTTPYYVMQGLGDETFNHLRYFIANKDYEALEIILFSPSPTSRLFAARTLLYMQEKSGYMPGDKTDQRIKETIAGAKLISSGILSCWMNKFDYDYYDIVKDFEKLLLTQ